MKKIAFIMMAVTIIGKLFGFGGEIALSYFYGTSSISDAYLVSLTIPSVLFSLVGAGISTGYIPVFSEVLKERGNQGANQFTNQVIHYVMILCTIIVIVVLVFAEQIVGIFAAGFRGETYRLAVLFTRIAILSLWFSGLIYLFNGYLQLKNDFISPGIMVIPLNITILLAIVVSAKTNVVFLAIGNTLSLILQCVLLLPMVFKKGYRYSFRWHKGDVYLKKMLFFALPIILGTSVNQINRLVDRNFASHIALGGVSAINYAFKLDAFIQDIFVITLATLMYPMISKMAAEGNIKGLKKSIGETMGGINLFLLPATLGALIFAQPIVRLLFGRGAFDEQAIQMTSTALFFYSIGMIGMGLREVLTRGFYSLQDSRTPMINALVAILFNMALNYIFVKYLKIGGIALATSLSILLSTLLLFVSFRKKVGPFGFKSIGISFVKMFIASLIMAGGAKMVYGILLGKVGSNISLMLSIALGAIIYFIIIYFMKIKEVDVMVKSLKDRVKRV